MVLVYIEWIALGSILVAFAGLLISIISISRTRVRGPRFVLNEVFIEYPSEGIDEKRLKLLLLLQNTGDRMGYLRITKLQIEAKNISKAFEISNLEKGKLEEIDLSNLEKLTNKKWLVFLLTLAFTVLLSSDSAKKEQDKPMRYSWKAEAQSQIEEEFVIDVPKIINFEDTYMIATGFYFNHKGKVKFFSERKKIHNFTLIEKKEIETSN